MKKTIRILLTAALMLVFLFSITKFLGQQRDKRNGSSTYEKALQIATSEKNKGASPTLPATTGNEDPSQPPQWIPAPVEEEDPYLQAMADIDLAALREVNPDVIGWIMIPDTGISYPLMQGTDNDYYLNRTWDRQSNAVGSIFLEYQNNPDLTDFNTIIYGHNMNDGSMFAGLREYRNQDFWEVHPYVYICNDLGVYRYEIFSAYYASVKSNTYGLVFSREESRINFLAKLLEDSVIQTGVEPTPNDRILTLSTCTGTGSGYAYRWVVHARLKMVQQY